MNKCTKNNCQGCSKCDGALNTNPDYIANGQMCEETPECAKVYDAKCIAINEEIPATSPGGFFIAACTRLYDLFQMLVMWLNGPIYTYVGYASDEQGSDFSTSRYNCLPADCAVDSFNTAVRTGLSSINNESTISDCGDCNDYFSDRFVLTANDTGALFSKELSGLISADYPAGDLHSQVTITISIVSLTSSTPVYAFYKRFKENSSAITFSREQIITDFLADTDVEVVPLNQGEEYTFQVPAYQISSGFEYPLVLSTGDLNSENTELQASLIN